MRNICLSVILIFRYSSAVFFFSSFSFILTKNSLQEISFPQMKNNSLSLLSKDPFRNRLESEYTKWRNCFILSVIESSPQR